MTATPPHSEHRKKVLELFEPGQRALIYLRGGELLYRYDTDYEFPFRQESSFWYLSGVPEPDYTMILEVDSGTFHLFPPNRDASYAVWHGTIRTSEEIIERYSPDKLHSDSEPEEWIKAYGPDTLYCLNEDQADEFDLLSDRIRIDTDSLADALTWARSIKTGWELEQLREAARINNIAHRELLEAVRPGMKEYECKAIFEEVQVRNGLVFDAYNGIHASGPNSAILHYTGLDRTLRDGDLYLVDAGHEMNGYASDFSRTYPVSGSYTAQQRAVYEIVLNAQNRAIEGAGPGVKMEELHMLAARVITEGLLSEGWLKGSPDELMEKSLFALFFPHGLGHFLGLDTHDVGGYPKGVEKIDRPGLQNLRVRRELQPGMVITIEPGIYLIPALLEPAFNDPGKARFLNRDLIAPLFQFGGVRIEDNLIITEEGNENLTDVPKTPDEIESIRSAR